MHSNVKHTKGTTVANPGEFRYILSKTWVVSTSLSVHFNEDVAISLHHFHK